MKTLVEHVALRNTQYKLLCTWQWGGVELCKVCTLSLEIVKAKPTWLYKRLLLSCLSLGNEKSVSCHFGTAGDQIQ